jgi:hypothetical protein
MSRRGRVAAVVILALGLGCRGRSGDGEPTPAPAPIETASRRAPADHLAPGELIEGTQVALGVTLPRDLHLEETFTDVAYAKGLAPVHSLVQYFRARLRDGSLREGDTTATFDHVHAPGRPDRELSVHIAETIGAVRVEMRDTTPPPQSNLPDDEARFRQVGLRPDGQWLDPTHLN